MTNFPAVAAAIKHTLENQGFTKLVGAKVVSIDPGVVVMALDRRPEVLQQNGLSTAGCSPIWSTTRRPPRPAR